MATAPSEFSTLGLDASRFRLVDQRGGEWHGPCPRCGGHDRFVIFTDREFPHWNWWCRQCHPESGWADELNPMLKEPLSPEKRLQLAEARIERAEQEIKRARQSIETLRRERPWERYQEQQTDYSRRQWNSWGVPDFWQDYWQLGYDPAHTIWTPDGEWQTPSLTIPIFEDGTWACLNVRHRLLNPPNAKDKYRPEISGLPAAMFVADPDNRISGKTLLVEGEKKAMVAYITADDPDMQVVGIPGKNPSQELLQKLADADPVYICLDPDASREADKIAVNLISERVRIVELPDKIDDLIIEHLLDKRQLRQLMKTARRA